jgi:hypothetical protein
VRAQGPTSTARLKGCAVRPYPWTLDIFELPNSQRVLVLTPSSPPDRRRRGSWAAGVGWGMAAEDAEKAAEGLLGLTRTSREM